jgi:hypothetical protein
MISNVIDLTLALSKAGDKAVLVTKDDSVVEALKKHGKEIANKTGVKHLIVQKHDPPGVRRNYSVDYEGVEDKYGDKTVMIIGKIATLSAESIKNNIKDGVFSLTLNGKEYEIEEKYLKEETTKPKDSEIIDFGKGYVYLAPESEEEPEEEPENKEESVSD